MVNYIDLHSNTDNFFFVSFHANFQEEEEEEEEVSYPLKPRIMDKNYINKKFRIV